MNENMNPLIPENDPVPENTLNTASEEKAMNEPAIEPAPETIRQNSMANVPLRETAEEPIPDVAPETTMAEPIADVISEATTEEPIPDVVPEATTAGPVPHVDPIPKKKKTNKVLVGGIILVAAAAAGGGIYYGVTHSSKNASATVENKNVILNAYFDEDGKGYFVKENGEVTEFEADENAHAYMTKDRNHFIVSDKDGVRVLDAAAEEIAKIDADDSQILIGYDVLSDKAACAYELDEDDVDTIKKRIIEDYNKENYYTITKKDFDDYYDYRFDDTVEDAKECYEINLDKEYDSVYSPEQHFYYCSYESGEFKDLTETLELSSDTELLDGQLAENADTLYVVTEEGLYKYDSSMEKAEKIQGVRGDEIDLLYVSDDGEQVFWADSDSDATTIYTYSGADVVKFGLFEDVSSYYGPSILKVGDNDTFCCMIGEEDHLLYGDINGENVEKIQLKENLIRSLGIYDSNGSITNQHCNDEDGMYVFLGEDTEDANLYYITFADGEREKVDSDIYTVHTIKNGKIIYGTEDGNLYTAPLDKGVMGDEEKIASDIAFASEYFRELRVYGEDTESLYYVKEMNSDEDALYYWNGTDSEKIEEDEEIDNIIWYQDGSCTYGMDWESIKYSDWEYGTLYTTLGTEGTKISNDIIRCKDFTEKGNPKDFLLYRYNHADDENVYIDVLHYDGTETEKVLSDVILAN